MIAHISVPARDPRRTALFLAALIDGEVFGFPVVPGAMIAVARDGSGLAIEIYPDTLAHHPGHGEPDPGFIPVDPRAQAWEDQIHADGEQLRPSAFHAALVSRLGDDTVEALAQKAGFRTVRCDRAGVFRLVEVWLDNFLLLEVLNPAEAERYRSFMNPAGCAAMFGAGERPAIAA
jgi:hypothetical protein